jgi:O-antigen biosynthesis protein WbqP
MKRIFDLFLAIILLILFAPIFIVVAIIIKISDPGPALYWSKRVGRQNKLFMMPKFRSMKLSTPQVATHLLTNPEQYLISIGAFIRKSSIDELPQLLSVIKGDMSFVGPRPALFNQDDLIELRTQYGVHELLPGITGWAQINGRDEIPIPKKVEYEVEYLKRKNFLFDLKIIFLTAYKVIKKENVSH